MSKDLRLLTAINRALQHGPEVTLDPDEIEDYVVRRARVSRVPGYHWRPAYEQLCADLERHAQLTRLGRIMANGQLVGLLKARCRAELLLAKHAEIHDQPVTAPIIIMGPMRSGSTRLQRLLACDPQFAWTRLFESLFPVPGRGRKAAATAVYGTLRALNPAVQQIHPSGPLRPDEEFGYLSFAFHSGQFAVQWNVPVFVAAERRRDLRPVAQELQTLLQMNSWARGGVGERRWLLKCPAYTGMAEALFKVFPDARLICLSRDPVKVVASSASLVVQQRQIHSDAVDPVAVGREWLDRTAERQRQLAAARTVYPQVLAFDLFYDEISADWEGAIHRLYRFLGMPLTALVLAAMRRYMARAKAHRGHRYGLEEFGLTEADVTEAFAQPERPMFAPPAVVRAAVG